MENIKGWLIGSDESTLLVNTMIAVGLPTFFWLLSQLYNWHIINSIYVAVSALVCENKGG